MEKFNQRHCLKSYKKDDQSPIKCDTNEINKK